MHYTECPVILRTTYIRRIAEQPPNDVLVGDRVGVVLGARQVGKTTLVEHVLAGRPALVLNFDVEVDLVVKHRGGLQAFEIKWSPRRTSGRAFRDAYGLEVTPVGPENPLAASTSVSSW